MKMGIPRKRSRKLELTGGRKFIFLVKETTMGEDLDQKELSITVQEDAKKPGRCLQFKYPYGVEVTPSCVALIVNEALSNGWDPTERGGVFSYDIAGRA